MNKPKSYLLKFEVLSESKAGNLVNGFSAAIGMSDTSSIGGRLPTVNVGCSNNCSGGNCVSGCGGGPSDAVIICTLK